MANSLVETEPKLAWNIQHTAVRATTEFTPVWRQNSSKELNAKEKEMLILQIDQRIISQPKGVYWIAYRNIELKYVYLEKSRFWKLVYIFHTWLHRFNRNKLSSLLELFAKKISQQYERMTCVFRLKNSPPKSAIPRAIHYEWVDRNCNHLFLS